MEKLLDKKNILEEYYQITYPIGKDDLLDGLVLHPMVR